MTENTQPVVSRSDELTEAQLEFARLLGRLLAEKWIQEHSRHSPDSGHAGHDAKGAKTE
jgi:hypothetical protein